MLLPVSLVNGLLCGIFQLHWVSSDRKALQHRDGQRRRGRFAIRVCHLRGGLWVHLGHRDLPLPLQEVLPLLLRHCFFFGNALAFASTLSVLYPSFWTLLFGRLVQGFCLGFFTSIVPIMIKEYTPVELSGPMGTLYFFFFSSGYTLGFLVSFVLGQFFPP